MDQGGPEVRFVIVIKIRLQQFFVFEAAEQRCGQGLIDGGFQFMPLSGFLNLDSAIEQ